MRIFRFVILLFIPFLMFYMAGCAGTKKGANLQPTSSIEQAKPLIVFFNALKKMNTTMLKSAYSKQGQDQFDDLVKNEYNGNWEKLFKDGREGLKNQYKLDITAVNPESFKFTYSGDEKSGEVVTILPNGVVLEPVEVVKAAESWKIKTM